MLRVEIQGETYSFIQPSAFIGHLLCAIERDRKMEAVWALYFTPLEMAQSVLIPLF